MAEPVEDWVAAATAINLLQPFLSVYTAQMAIAARANDGVIRSRASRFVRGKKIEDNVELPPQFWWARGDAALEQNWKTGDFETWIEHREHWRAYGIQFLRADIERLIPDQERADMTKAKSSVPQGANVFIGHGRSLIWRELKDFLVDRLGLPYDEFNAQSAAGLATSERLGQMLDDASFAFLVLTAEDERSDGTMQARMNVIHEVGLFQGRLGFAKAIVLMEEGCQEFTNITGLTQIRFPAGKISAAFEDVRRVLEREGII